MPGQGMVKIGTPQNIHLTELRRERMWCRNELAIGLLCIII